jgi:hypothetical protein
LIIIIVISLRLIILNVSILLLIIVLDPGASAFRRGTSGPQSLRVQAQNLRAPEPPRSSAEPPHPACSQDLEQQLALRVVLKLGVEDLLLQ